MTTPNDTPRPTSDLVKRLLEYTAMQDKFYHRIGADLTQEAAASLQSLEARNKELEGALSVVRISGGNNARAREDARFGDVVIAAAAWDAVIAALHPATKTAT